MRCSRFAATSLIAALTLTLGGSAIAAPALAGGGSSGSHASHRKDSPVKRVDMRGTLDGVDAEGGTITATVRIRGGGQGPGKSAAGWAGVTTVEISVADGARIVRDGEAASLADLEAGDRVRVKGTYNRTTGEAVALRVKAYSAADEPEPTPSPSPDPSPSPLTVT